MTVRTRSNEEYTYAMLRLGGREMTSGGQDPKMKTRVIKQPDSLFNGSYGSLEMEQLEYKRVKFSHSFPGIAIDDE